MKTISCEQIKTNVWFWKISEDQNKNENSFRILVRLFFKLVFPDNKCKKLFIQQEKIELSFYIYWSYNNFLSHLTAFVYSYKVGIE